MAGFMDMLNQGLSNATGTPLGQLGINMLMSAGPQPGNPGAGVRLGQAFGGMQQMQGQQQELEYRKMLREQQAQEIQLRQAALMQSYQQREALKKLAQENPDFLANNPMARAMIGATGDTGLAADIAKLQPVPKPPTMPGVFEKYNPDNTVTQQIWNPQTNSYDSGPAYVKPEQMRAQAYADKTSVDIAQAPQELDIKSQQAEAARQRVQVMQTEAARKQAASALKNRVSMAELNQGYRGSVTQIDDAISLADELLKPDSGLEGNFGMRGWVPNAPGIDAANARAKLERLKAKSGLTELVRLGNQGVRLTPVSDNDIKVVQSSVMNLDKAQDVTSARKELERYRNALLTAKSEAETNYNEIIGAYQPPGQQPAQLQQSAQPVRINDDAGYNALPSGATFIAPDGSTRRKP